MKMWFVLLCLFAGGLAHAGNMPMESITKYNVVLVHGAAYESEGIDGCGSGAKDVYSFLCY